MHASQALLYLILIIIAARIGGEIAERLGQPAVLGEILAGIGLGVIPFFQPAIDNEAIKFIAEIGVILLLFEVGLESQFDDVLRVLVPAVMVALIGVILPLCVGFGVLYALGWNWMVALFLGATLTATSVGVTARVFRDLGRANSSEARIVIGAAVVDDILGLLVLSIVLGLVDGGALTVRSITLTIVLAIGFLVAAIAIGLRFAPVLIELAKKLRGRGMIAVTAFVFCLGLAYVGSLIGLAAIVGAFAAGLVLASTEDRARITQRIQPLSDIFVPVFFAMVGMQVKIHLFADLETDKVVLLLLAIAIPTKIVAGLGVVRKRVDKLVVGLSMIPRGEVGLIFASVGLAHAIIDEKLYGAVVIMALLTTVMTPPLVKRRLASRLAALSKKKAGDTAEDLEKTAT